MIFLSGVIVAVLVECFSALFIVLIPSSYRHHDSWIWSVSLVLHAFGLLLLFVPSSLELYLSGLEYPISAVNMTTIGGNTIVALSYLLLHHGAGLFFEGQRPGSYTLSLLMVTVVFISNYIGHTVFVSAVFRISLYSGATGIQFLLTTLLIRRNLPYLKEQSRNGNNVHLITSRLMYAGFLTLTLTHATRLAVVSLLFKESDLLNPSTMSFIWFALDLISQSVIFIAFIVANFTFTADSWSRELAGKEEAASKGLIIAGLSHEINNPAHWMSLSSGTVRDGAIRLDQMGFPSAQYVIASADNLLSSIHGIQQVLSRMKSYTLAGDVPLASCTVYPALEMAIQQHDTDDITCRVHGRKNYSEVAIQSATMIRIMSSLIALIGSTLADTGRIVDIYLEETSSFFSGDSLLVRVENHSREFRCAGFPFRTHLSEEIQNQKRRIARLLVDSGGTLNISCRKHSVAASVLLKKVSQRSIDSVSR